MRQELEAPDLPAPRSLTQTEQQIVCREINRGADETKLASYFKTEVAEIRRAIEVGEITGWIKNNRS